MPYVSPDKRAAESITGVLCRLNNGDGEAYDDLVPLVYREMRRIAEGYLRRESPDHTLQPTALVHEAYLKMIAYEGVRYQSRKHFYATAAKVMRRILVDHARARDAFKRGGGRTVALGPEMEVADDQDSLVISLDDALTALAKVDRDMARLVEMRFFGGMSAEEIAGCVDAPVHAVRRDLRAAQFWLRREIET